VRALCDEITRATEVEMGLEGMYDWIAFLPSKVNARRPVAARYYGVFSDGHVKFRGLTCRRSDVPQFVKDSQLEMLAILAKARTLDDRSKLAEEVSAVIKRRMRELESGKVNPRMLLIKRRLTKDLDGYRDETRTAIAARQLSSAGVKRLAGEGVSSVITDAQSKNKSRRVNAEEEGIESGYDADECVKLFKAAVAEVMYLMGDE
jgi:DNA polymerase-2